MQQPAVPAPEKGAAELRAGKTKHVYKVLRTFRTQNGAPSNERKLIGKLSPDGRLIPNANYFKLCERPASIEPPPPAAGVDADEENRPRRAAKRMGSSFLMHMLLIRSGADSILRSVFGADLSEMILSIAVCMRSCGSAMARIAHWCGEFSIACGRPGAGSGRL